MRNIFKISRIKRLCKRYKIKNYTINKDYSIDVEGNVSLSDHDMIVKYFFGEITYYRLPIKFNRVNGRFNCSNCNLKSLEGSPKYADSFDCSNNKLRSLVGGPTHVRTYDFSLNNVRSLEGMAISTGYRGISCTGNPIYELWSMFQDASKIELFNDYDIVRDEDKDKSSVVYDRLLDFMSIIKPHTTRTNPFVFRDLHNYNTIR